MMRIKECERGPCYWPTFQGQAPVSDLSHNTTEAPQKQIPASYLRSVFDCVLPITPFGWGLEQENT